MSLSTLPVLADWNNDEDIMSLLSELNIMVGDDDGNLRLDDNVSRAEFAKIAVASSSYKDTVATGLKVSPFKDVTYRPLYQPELRRDMLIQHSDLTIRYHMKRHLQWY